MRINTIRGVVLATTAALATVGTAGTAGAADTTTTFAITAGTGLAISAPTSKALGSANLDATSVAAALGTVRVDDTRAGLLSSWTATASSSDFIYDADESDLTTDDRNVISNSAVNYDPGALPTGSSLVLTVPVPGTSGSLASPRTAFAVVSVTGSNWVEWNPTVTVALPASGKVAGTYTGTIIHSVS